MQSFLKKLSLFIFYLPALCFGSQLFYYFGLFTASETSVFALGLNNNEVTFLGANELIIMIAKAFNTIFQFIKNHIITVFYVLFYSFFIWYWWKPETNQRKKLQLQIIFNSFLFDFKNKTMKSMYDLDHKIWLFSIKTYITLGLVSILLTFYLSFYHRGTTDFSEALKHAHKQQQIILEHEEKNTLPKKLESIGILKENNQKIYVLNLACGNYKCVGIQAKDLVIRTYLPENYSIEVSQKLKDQYLKEN